MKVLKYVYLGIGLALLVPVIWAFDFEAALGLVGQIGVASFLAVMAFVLFIQLLEALTWQATIRGIYNMGTGEWVGSLQIPIWPMRMLFAFGCLLTFIVLVSQLIAHFTPKADTEGD